MQRRFFWLLPIAGVGLILAGPLTAQKKAPPKPAQKTTAKKPSPPATPASTPSTTPTSIPAQFVGTACTTDADCSFPGGFCLSEKEGFPGGYCSVECDVLCPRPDFSLVASQARQPAAPTICASAKSIGLKGNKGYCLRLADMTQPDGACRKGYKPEVTIRHSSMDRVRWACAPSQPEITSCKETQDEIAELAYPEKGAVYLPKETRCGGRFDVLIMFHGDQANVFRQSPNLGPGDNNVDKIERELIDAGLSKPVIIAQPIENAWTCTLWDEDGFSPGFYMTKLREFLDARGIEIGTLSIMGHSRGACCLRAGVYRMGEFLPDLKLWGKSDGCYGDDGFNTWPEKWLGKTNTVLFSVQMPKKVNPKTSKHLEMVVTKTPQKVECKAEEFKSCYKNPEREWYSFQSDFLPHREIPKLFIREVLTRFFAPAPTK